MSHIVEATEIFSVNYVQTDCWFIYDGGPGTDDPDCVALCIAADD